MQSLESMFEEQQRVAAAGEIESEEDAVDVFVRFTIDDSWFMVPIDKVRVVVDHPVIVPYPEEVDGHIGVASLRGEVLPVIQVGQRARAASVNANSGSDLRLMFLEFVQGSAFGILVRTPKKVHISRVKVANHSIVNVGGDPTHVVRDAGSIVGGGAP